VSANRASWVIPLVLLTGVGCIDPVAAATRTWDGSTDNRWSIASNWQENAAPMDGDDLVFPPGQMNTTNNNDLVGLDVNSIAISDSAYVLIGNSITLAAAGVTDTSPSGITNISLDIAIPATVTITNTIASVAFNGVISGAGGIIKNGPGSIFFSGANTYAGVTSINQGGIEIFNNTGLGSTANGTTVASASNDQRIRHPERNPGAARQQ
jgi:autotransporter-associated beta strand protein